MQVTEVTESFRLNIRGHGFFSILVSERFFFVLLAENVLSFWVPWKLQLGHEKVFNLKFGWHLVHINFASSGVGLGVSLISAKESLKLRTILKLQNIELFSYSVYRLFESYDLEQKNTFKWTIVSRIQNVWVAYRFSGKIFRKVRKWCPKNSYFPKTS